MNYEVELKPQAIRDLASLPRNLSQRVIAKVERMRNGLVGDIKRLTNFTPEYRLRVGDYRVLFEVEGSQIVVYRVLHRREAYDR